MKQYKKHYGHYTIFTNTNTYYVINKKIHGIYIVFSSFKNNPLYKGYLNMDIEYSHWKEYKKKNKTFNYYL